MTTHANRELAILRFLQELDAHMDEIRDEEGVLRYALRSAQQFFRAQQACAAILDPPHRRAEVHFSVPKNFDWDPAALTAFAEGANPVVPNNVIGAGVTRRGRQWSAFVLRRRTEDFKPGDGRCLARVTALVAAALQRQDDRRVRGVRERLDRKIMEKLRPRDMFYQLLHGLRSLIRYDHSSALLISVDDGESLELAAEQLTCIKGKSRSIGRRWTLNNEHRTLLGRPEVYGFDRHGELWQEWQDHPAAAVAELLDYNRSSSATSQLAREGAMVCTPIATRSGVIGVLKVAMLHPGTLGPCEAEILQRFKSQASIAIQYLQGTESLKRKMLVAERKQVMANIARGVSHDINNALGAVLPLVQQLRQEAEAGIVEPAVLAQDLQQIERSLQASRRIFGGMLALARGSARTVGEGNVRRAIESALAILEDGMKRLGIALQLEISDDLPSVRVRQNDLTQLFLNLTSNARDAMPQGGRLSVWAEQTDGRVEIRIQDTGSGIDPADVPRLEEPFFTTKESGNGLGLAICRSVLTEARGEMSIASELGIGTTVHVALPASETGDRKSKCSIS